jgi:hypothetical protein
MQGVERSELPINQIKKIFIIIYHGIWIVWVHIISYKELYVTSRTENRGVNYYTLSKISWITTDRNFLSDFQSIASYLKGLGF